MKALAGRAGRFLRETAAPAVRRFARRWLLRRPLPRSSSPKGREAATRLRAHDLWDGAALWTRRTPAWTIGDALTKVNGALPGGAAAPPALTNDDVADAIVVAAEQDAAGWRAAWWARQAVLPLGVAGLVWLYATREAPQQAVTLRRAVPAYHVLTLQDLTTSPVVFTANAPTDPQTIVGRYLPRAGTRGEVLDAGELVDGRRVRGLASRILLTVPVAAPDTKLASTLPAVVTVEPAAKAITDLPNQPKPIQDVYVLALASDAKGTTATIALTSDQMQRLRPALSRFDIVLAWEPGQ